MKYNHAQGCALENYIGPKLEDREEEGRCTCGTRDNVVILPVITTLHVPPERVLESALKADLNGVFVAGYTKDGSLYFASSYADGGDVMWLMEIAKARLLKIAGEPR